MQRWQRASDRTVSERAVGMAVRGCHLGLATGSRQARRASEQKVSECSGQNGCGGMAAPATALAQGRQAVQRTLKGGQGIRPGMGAPVSLQQQERGGQAPCNTCWMGSRAHDEPQLGQQFTGSGALQPRGQRYAAVVSAEFALLSSRPCTSASGPGVSAHQEDSFATCRLTCSTSLQISRCTTACTELCWQVFWF